MDGIIRRHILQQISTADAWTETWTKDVKGTALKTRYMGILMEQYVRDFMQGKNTKRWVIIPGLRGVGKTTLLAQQYQYVKNNFGADVNLLHLSLHDVVNVVGGTLKISIEQYEAILGSSIEQLKKPTFLFLDEVQEDEKWADILFSIHERTRNIFIFCSGSSAIYLKNNANMVRRAHIEQLFPLSYTEYNMLRFGVNPIPGLKAGLKSAVFSSKNAEEAHKEIIKLLPKIRGYLSSIDTLTFSHFMGTGSLPFLVDETNPSQVYNGIMSLIERIINEDLGKTGNFDSATLNAVKPLLFMLAEGDVVSRANLAKALGIDARVVGSLLEALVKTELLIEVPARGNASTAVTKPKKYLFMSPAIRATFYQIAGQSATEQTNKGRLLEDLFGLYMYREYTSKKAGYFTYNAGKGLADFTLMVAGSKCIPIEIGLGEKNSRQVVTTMKTYKCDYGVVVSSTKLHVDKKNNILFLPLSIFYLM